MLFGLAHAESLQLLGLAVFGIILSFVAYRTGRLGMNMVAHATFNLTACSPPWSCPSPSAPGCCSEMAAPVDVAPVGPAPSESRPAPPPPGAGLGRIARRRAWPAWTNLAVVAGVTLVALTQLHPSLLLSNTTTAGGDTGAHVICRPS